MKKRKQPRTAPAGEKGVVARDEEPVETSVPRKRVARGRPSPAQGSERTANGTATATTAGYGTSQGASGATSGGADPGGSLNIPPV